MPSQPEVNIGTAGHVDHGKTTILQALTGVWTSSHSEELRRGITIKIGYVDMPVYECRALQGPSRFSVSQEMDGCEGGVVLRRAVSFVDCPGHESLMANMLSGAAVMDGAMLVVAANEEVPRPQTKEHLVALELLGVDQILIVQNKVDLVSRDETLDNYQRIVSFVDETVAEGAPIIPFSAVRGLNMPYLLEAIETTIRTPERSRRKDLRMSIIRSFDINFPGKRFDEISGGVIGGSILEGKLEEGAELEILPGYLHSKDGGIEHVPLYTEALSISSGRLRLEEAHAGGLIGVQTDLDPALAAADSLVGNVIGKPGTLPEVLFDFEMETTLFKYVVGTDEMVEARPIRPKEPLRLNVGAAVTLGTVSDVKGDTAHVGLAKPVVAESGWRAAIARRVGSKWRLIGVGDIR
ncbi:MAG: translation initiation factor IF-2 subunit gamma [Candidatus Geothermarchaeales archaeon]